MNVVKKESDSYKAQYYLAGLYYLIKEAKKENLTSIANILNIALNEATAWIQRGFDKENKGSFHDALDFRENMGVYHALDFFATYATLDIPELKEAALQDIAHLEKKSQGLIQARKRTNIIATRQ